MQTFEKKKQQKKRFSSSDEILLGLKWRRILVSGILFDEKMQQFSQTFTHFIY